jgi:hypothetical protein
MKTLFGALASASLLSTGALAAGNTLHVANNGTDSPTCGASNAACRSISQSIANATAGDTILVGPGRYGDLDFDGALGWLGEETGNPDPASQGGVYVNKSLTILSTAGAEATIIDMGGSKPAAVEIVASNVRFGDREQGFTLTGTQTYGLYSHRSGGISISGNISHSVPFAGFVVYAEGPDVEVRHNLAFANGAGFLIASNDPDYFVVFQANSALNNQTGVITGSIGAHRVIANRVSGNTAGGFAVNWGSTRFTRNQVTGNRIGASVNGYDPQTPQTGPVFTRNNFVGNTVNGIDVFPGPANARVRLRENNIFGNDNCGTTNQSDATLDARHNFWGAATGPGFNHPADMACPGAQPTLTTPFATTAFDVN